MQTKKFHPKLCHIVRNLTLTHIITLIAVSVCILRHFFIETMTTTLPYESRTSKMQQEQVIQSDCRNTNTNFNHDINPYHNSNPRNNIGISRCKGTGPFLSPPILARQINRIRILFFRYYDMLLCTDHKYAKIK